MIKQSDKRLNTNVFYSKIMTFLILTLTTILVYTPVFAIIDGVCKDAAYGCTSGGYAGFDPWGFYISGSEGKGGKHNCTSYAAFRAASNGAKHPGVNLGNANTWSLNAKSKGVSVDDNPSVGAIANWTTGLFGHVAYVESVQPNGVWISEDNYDPISGGWTARRFVSRYSGWPNSFIHFADIIKQPPIKLKKKFNLSTYRDINGDGKSDLLFRDVNNGTVRSWITNSNNMATDNGYGSFGKDFKNWESLNMGDINNDKKADLIVKNSVTGEVRVWVTNSQNLASDNAYGSLGSGHTNWEYYSN